MSTDAPVREVPFFRYPSVFTEDEAELLEVICEVGRRGAFIMQRDLEEFEQRLAEYLGAKYVIGVGNATDGLHLAVRAAGIGPGDEVIFASHTMVASAAAIHFAGATPVPVECGPDHLIDPQAVAAAITPRTRAIMPTQLNGRTADMEALGRLADQHGLGIIEDAAQGLGSRFRGRAAGTFGLAGAISFYPAKLLGCLGDGGCVVTNDQTICERVRQLRDHGRGEDGDIVAWGLNSRLDNLQAAILSFRFAGYDRAIARRRAIAAHYRRRLEGLAQLVLPPGPDDDADHFDVYQNYEIEAERRDQLRNFLQQRGVGTMLPWGGKAVHQFPKLGLAAHLPYTDRLFTRVLLLPMNTSLTDDEVEYVCDQVCAFYQT